MHTLSEITIDAKLSFGFGLIVLLIISSGRFANFALTNGLQTSTTTCSTLPDRHTKRAETPFA